MTEKEIIEYLKQNKNKGVIFAFMPEDVQKWCKRHCNEPVFMHFWNKKWEELNRIACTSDSVYVLVDDYKPQFEPYWEEFDIDGGGYFYYEGDAFYYRDDVAFEKRYPLTFKGFGGWLFNDKIWCTNPQVTIHTDIEEESISDFVAKNDICKPLIPTKIRFWRYTE